MATVVVDIPEVVGVAVVWAVQFKLPVILGMERKAEAAQVQEQGQVVIIVVATTLGLGVERVIVLQDILAPVLMEAVADMFIPLLPTAVRLPVVLVRNGFPRCARE